jgi:hypothetical protein
VIFSAHCKLKNNKGIACYVVKIIFKLFMPFALEDLAAIVNERSFNRLIGEAENQFFDAKAQPYLFDGGEDSKREFAKDVSAFANATGGYIFIGLTTNRAAIQLGDEVTEVRPIPAAMFDPDRHQKILEEWLHPLPANLSVQFAQYGTDSSKGIGVIHVPKQDDRSKPFLLTRSLGDKKSTELLFGYAERRVDRTQVRGVAEIQQAIKNGLDIERTLVVRLDNIELLISRHFTNKKETETAEQRQKLLHERILNAFGKSFDESKRMTIAATPLDSVELKTIFSQEPGSIWQKLEAPPKLRSQGWGLPSRSQAKPIRGEMLQVVETGRMVINLWRDGTLLLLGDIDRDFLAWSDKSDSHLHPLALIELIVNFTRFFGMVLEDMDSLPKEIEIQVVLSHMRAGEKAVLVSGPVGKYGPEGSPRMAPSNSLTIKRRFPVSPYDPNFITFTLVREIYAWFGHAEEAIPYVSKTPSGKSIDPNQITNIG